MPEPWPEEPTIWFGDELDPVVTVHLPREPVSQGAQGKKRRGLIAELQQLTRQVPWMFTGDVSVVIEWTVHLQWRYESDRALDVDNIVKPILDGTTGPHGVLIDDTQVNHVSVNWITWTRTDRQHLRIELRSLDQDLYQRKGFALVEVRPALCLPMPALADDSEARGVFWSMVQMQFNGYDDLRAMGAPWETARMILPNQRLFHRNKLGRFTVLTPDEYVRGPAPAGESK
jgi:Holliday junction resolvase RusA-like endonuclease